MDKKIFKNYLKYLDAYTAKLSFNSALVDGIVSDIDEIDETDISSVLNIVELLINNQVSVEGFDDEEKRSWLFDILMMLEKVINERLKDGRDEIINIITQLKNKINFPSKDNSRNENGLFRDQQTIYSKLKSFIEKKENAVISAPTSFGKSFLLRKIICEIKGGNYFFIVPTIALQNEYFVELQKENNPSNFFVGIDVMDDHKFYKYEKNIFILTQEKMVAFFRSIFENKKDVHIDYVIFDEFQEFLLEPFEVRGATMYSVLQFFKDRNVSCTFSLPLIAKPEVKINKLVKGYEIDKDNILVTKINYAVKDFFQIKNKDIYFNDLKNAIAEFNEINDFNELILRLMNNFKDETTIVFATKREVKKKNFSNYPEFKISDEIKLTLNYISNNLAESHYYVHKALSRGIGIHHADIDFYLRKQIEYLYKNRIIHTIFANETLAHGVNLRATNLIFESEIDGRVHKSDSKKELTYKNLIGRVGRLNEPRGRVFLKKKNNNLRSTSKEIMLLDKQIDEDIETNIKSLDKGISEHKLENMENAIIKLTTNFSVFPFDEKMLIDANYGEDIIQKNKNSDLVYDASPVDCDLLTGAAKWIKEEKTKIKKIINHDSDLEYLDEFCEKVWSFFGCQYFKSNEKWIFLQTLKNKFRKVKVKAELSATLKSCKNNVFWIGEFKDYRKWAFEEPDSKFIKKYNEYNVGESEGYAVLVDYIIYKRKRYIDFGYMIFVSNIAYLYEKTIGEKLFDDNFRNVREKLISIGIETDLCNRIIELQEKNEVFMRGVENISNYTELIDLIADPELGWIIKTCFE
jgi:hypothetical protein